MALIDKNTFEIFDAINNDEIKNTFECDDLIAPAIRVLNLKGYKTCYCCSGHPFPSKTECLSYGSATVDDFYESFSGIYEIKEVKLEDLKDESAYERAKELMEGYSKPGDNKLYIIKMQQYVSNEAYISFEEGMLPNTLPEGWEFDVQYSIRVEMPATTEMEFFSNQVKVMEDLLKWANNLPVRP